MQLVLLCTARRPGLPAPTPAPGEVSPELFCILQLQARLWQLSDLAGTVGCGMTKAQSIARWRGGGGGGGGHGGHWPGAEKGLLPGLPGDSGSVFAPSCLHLGRDSARNKVRCFCKPRSGYYSVLTAWKWLGLRLLQGLAWVGSFPPWLPQHLLSLTGQAPFLRPQTPRGPPWPPSLVRLDHQWGQSPVWPGASGLWVCGSAGLRVGVRASVPCVAPGWPVQGRAGRV